jgi:DNA repair exonuclease SbcCD ATPase subunit
MRLFACVLLPCVFALSALAAENGGAGWQFEKVSGEYDTLKLETYESELAQAYERERVARQGIAEEQASIESLRQRLAETDRLIAQVAQEKYQILGITEQDVIAAENEVSSIRQELELLLGLTPDELAARAGELRKLEGRIATLKDRPVSYLWRIRDQIRQLDELAARVRANLPVTTQNASYTVKLVPQNRECLYRIAAYDFIYNDAAQWPRLYEANKELINTNYRRYTRDVEQPRYSRPEDLIDIGWQLDVPR